MDEIDEIELAIQAAAAGELERRELVEQIAKLKAALVDMKKQHLPVRIYPVCECLGCEALKEEE